MLAGAMQSDALSHPLLGIRRCTQFKLNAAEVATPGECDLLSHQGLDSARSLTARLHGHFARATGECARQRLPSTLVGSDVTVRQTDLRL